MKFNIVAGVITLFIFGWLITCPCIFHPFDRKHSSYDWGFKEATGYFPDEWDFRHHCSKKFSEMVDKIMEEK